MIKYIEKHEGKLIQQNIRPLQGNGMTAISKIPVCLGAKKIFGVDRGGQAV